MTPGNWRAFLHAISITCILMLGVVAWLAADQGNMFDAVLAALAGCCVGMFMASNEHEFKQQ